VAGAINAGQFLLAFRIATPKAVATRHLWLGAVMGGVGWTILQAVGGYLVGHELRNQSQVYGTFAVVLGLMAWVYLGVQLTVYSAELNTIARGPEALAKGDRAATIDRGGPALAGPPGRAEPAVPRATGRGGLQRAAHDRRRVSRTAEHLIAITLRELLSSPQDRRHPGGTASARSGSSHGLARSKVLNQAGYARYDERASSTRGDSSEALVLR
jgi:hypothetical protein